MTVLLPSVEKIRESIVLPISKEYYSLFQSEGVQISSLDLNELINRFFDNAVNNFNKLDLSGKYCLPAYVAYWIREELVKVLAAKTLRRVNWSEDNPRETQNLEAIKNFFSILPPGSFASLERQLLKAGSLAKRKNVFRQYRPVLNKLKKPFEDLVDWRNTFAKKRKLPNYIFYIREKDRIPDNEYELFTKNVDKVISYCYSQLPKAENLPDWFYSRYNHRAFCV